MEPLRYTSVSLDLSNEKYQIEVRKVWYQNRHARKKAKKDKVYEPEYKILKFPSDAEEEDRNSSALENILEEVLEKQLEDIFQNYKLKDYLPKRQKRERYTPLEEKSLEVPASKGTNQPRIIYKSLASMPRTGHGQVYGYYDPNTHTIAIASDVPKHVRDWVYYHEYAHSLGIHDEALADDYAYKMTGYRLRSRDEAVRANNYSTIRVAA